MRVWITSGRNSCILLILLFALAAPARAFAAVQFTEVMYDAPGADTGREWLEVTNAGAVAVDTAGYKLFESGVNHGLILVQGTTTLAAGESAVITANPQKFLADYPSYPGTLFKSSFDLNNTGETLQLKDKILAVVDSATYSSNMGAVGDGNSLHLSNGGWVAGAPNPGSSAPTKAIVKTAPVVAAPAKANTKTSAVYAKTTSTTPNALNSSQDAGNTFTTSNIRPLLQNISSVWLYMLALVALITLGVGAALYAKPPAPRAVTTEDSEEFELE